MLDRVARVDERRVAWILGAAIVGFGIMGARYVHDAVHLQGGWVGTVDLFGLHIHGFNLDGEVNFPTAFSGLLLLAASLVGLLCASRSRSLGIAPARLALVPLLIGYMALDEVWQIHERLEAWTGTDWQALYLPVFAFAAIVGLTLLPHLRRAAPAATLFAAGAAAWIVAQIIEFLQWDAHDHLQAPWSVVPEEVLEMVGSLLFLLAFLAFARYIVAKEAATASQPIEQSMPFSPDPKMPSDR